jgi:hypothetical protein
VIVVYKVDRLTRALSDFAKIVEILDSSGASFVSVTQAFNTTTSMGRLTLNVLLSFAQFEREVTGERIRDKIAASKKKGMWMGGPIPLGYDIVNRRLVVNEAEAETVRLIFEQHADVGTLAALADDLALRGVRSKRRVMRDGRIVGDKPYKPGALTYLLRNALYVGQVRHGDQVYPGEHPAILDEETWQASQRLLDRSTPRPPTGQLSILAGMLTDHTGNSMAPVHAIRGTKRYRYHVSRQAGGHGDRDWRLPAGDLEGLVQQAIHDLLCDPLRLAAELDCTILTPTVLARAESLATDREPCGIARNATADGCDRHYRFRCHPHHAPSKKAGRIDPLPRLESGRSGYRDRDAGDPEAARSRTPADPCRGQSACKQSRRGVDQATRKQQGCLWFAARG